MQNSDIQSFEDLPPFEETTNPFNLLRQACALLQKEFTNAEVYLAVINDLRRMRKYHYDVFVSMVTSVLKTVCITIQKCPNEKQVIASLVFVKELTSQYSTDAIGNCMEYLLPVILKASLTTSNEDIQEEAYNSLNSIANNMFYISTYETLCLIVSNSTESDQLSTNAFQTLLSLIFNWEVSTLLDHINLQPLLFMSYIYEIYFRNNNRGLKILKILFDKIGKENFEKLKEMNKEINETLNLIMGVESSFKKGNLENSKGINA